MLVCPKIKKAPEAGLPYPKTRTGRHQTRSIQDPQMSPTLSPFLSPPLLIFYWVSENPDLSFLFFLYVTDYQSSNRGVNFGNK